jgi:hypothetical protein
MWCDVMWCNVTTHRARDHRRCLLEHLSQCQSTATSCALKRDLPFCFSSPPASFSSSFPYGVGEGQGDGEGDGDGSESVLPGLAVVVQQMVFGTSRRRCSGTGVAYSRDPVTGARELYG